MRLLQLTVLPLLLLVLSGCQPAVTVSAPEQVAVGDDISDAFILRRADPWVYQAGNGYYFTASVPEFDRIELHFSPTIAGLAQAEAKAVWHKKASGPMSANIWAPELHRINGVWYLYFAAGEAERPFHIRMYVLSNTAADPLQGQWQELGRINSALDTFSLDATVFEHRDQHYMVWAQQDTAHSYNSALLLARLENPTTVAAPEVIISQPDLDWEQQGYKVNEGAAVLIRNGKIFIAYSASATDHHYAMGLLWADENADLLNPQSWHKAPQPVFRTRPEFKRFGPGHNSFVTGDNGEDLMFYHARDTLQLQGSPLTDGNRHTRWRVIEWSEDGFPLFNDHLPD
ncbi:family 43 glycosylhydrolase [Chromatiaceae bacterium AAb-1]|nr:family 43 glycosylhydrolase [Chromatiaceae bacterium AAb-1]